MKIIPLVLVSAQASLRWLTCLALLGTNTLADAPPPERRPKLLERVGNFFYNVANRLERSDIPDHPGYDQPAARHPQPPLADRSRNGEAPGIAPRNRYIAPINPDPRLLRPEAPAPGKFPGFASGDGEIAATRRPSSEELLKAAPDPTKTTAPLPEPAASGGNPKPAESSATDAPSRQKKGGAVPVAAKTEEITYPVAAPTNRTGRVKSPYSPYTELDIVGLPPGSLAKDPVTGKIFRLP